MEIKNMLDKKIKRNKFFISAGAGIVGFFLFKTFPFNLFSHNGFSGKKNISVKLNPHAVSRRKTGNVNVG